MFDATLNIVDSAVIVEAPVGDEKPTQAQLVLVLGIMLPIASAPGQPPLVAPGGALRAPMTKTGLVELIEAAQAAIDQMADEKKPSDIITATSLQGVDQMAQQASRFKDGR